MAIDMGYPNAGITSVIGQQGNPMGGVQQPVNTNQFNPQENIEDTIIRLYQTNVPIDQIAQMTGTDPAMVAQVINSSTGADTMSNMRPPPAPGGAPQMGMPQETFSPNMPTEPPNANGIGAQALTAINPQYAQQNPDAVGEAEKMDAQIVRTSREVFGIGEEKPDLVQEINAVELSVLEDFESEGDGQSSGVSGAVQENALMKIGLNDVFTNAGIGLEDRIDFFKHYISETMGIDYENLKEAPNQGMPYLAAASALLNASKSGDSRMSGLGQALVSFGTTKRQIERVNNKEAQNLLMTSFNLGLESMKIAQSGTKSGLGNIGQYIVPSVSSDPILMGDKEALKYQRQGLNLQKYSETKENPQQYAIPVYNADKSGVVYEYKTMTPTQAAARSKNIDSDLLTAGYTVNAVDATNARTFGFIKSPDGDVEQISMQEYLTLPTSDPRKEYEFMKAGETQAVFDLEDGIAKFISKSDLLKNPMTTLQDGTEVERYVPNTMMKTTTINADGSVTMMEGSQSGMKGYLGSRAELSERRETREKLKVIDVGTYRVIDDIDLVRRAAERGLFGSVAEFQAGIGGFISSGKESYAAYRANLIKDGKNVNKMTLAQMESNFEETYWAEMQGWEWVKQAQNADIKKGRLTSAVFTLALSSAKLLAEQKGRDISNADIERFMQQIGANANSVMGFNVIINDLENRVLNNYDRETKWYKDTQVMMDNPDGEGEEEIGNMSVSNFYFAPGARGEKTREFIDERRAELNKRRKSNSIATGGMTPEVSRGDSYTAFRNSLEKDKSGRGGKLAVSESTGQTMTWGKLASLIVYNESNNSNLEVREKVTQQTIEDAFPETPAGREDLVEFMDWYTSF